MELEHGIVAFIDSLGVIQGLLFGLILVVSQFKNKKPTLFLGVFIILFSLEPINNILQSLNLISKTPELLLLPTSFHFLAYPLFYIYIQKISIIEKTKPDYWILIPGVIEFIAGVFLFFLPVSVKLKINASPIHIIYFLVGMIYTFYILFLTLKWLKKHREEVENQYSSLSRRSLNWPELFIYFSIGLHLLILLYHISGNNYLYLSISVLNVILIYWLSFRGFDQKKILSYYSANAKADSSTLSANNDQKSTNQLTATVEGDQDIIDQPIIGKPLQAIITKVENYIANSNCYTDEDLTIIDISEAVKIHPKRISHAINTVLKTNFNNFINSYRVAYAKELLKTGKADNWSIEGIGSAAGFHSKTTFYAAFKKMEGTTPGKYKIS